MFLIKLDQTNLVMECLPLIALADLPLHTHLGEYIISPVPAVIGQEYDPISQQFLTASRRKWLTKLAFDNRFTMNEAVALKLAQNYPVRLGNETDAEYNTRCAIPAQLQVMASRMAMATYIDLDRADTIGGVQSLEQLGLLAAGRAAEILSGVIASSEYHPDA